MVDSVPKKARSSQGHEATNLVEMHVGRQESINGRCEVANFLNGSDFCGNALKNPITPALPLSGIMLVIFLTFKCIVWHFLYGFS